MKRIITIALLAFLCIPSFAQKSFVADGITYRIIKLPDESSTFGLVSVAPREVGRYEGDIEIPNAVKESNDEYADSYRVVGIDAKAFAECEKLSSLIIPASVESIGEMAFYLSGLETITIPMGNLTAIPDRAFYCCSLKSIVLPSTIRSIGYQAFASGELESFKSKGPLQSIGAEAFAYSKLKYFTCAAAIEYIGDYAFKDCVSLTTMDIKGGIKVAGKNIYSGCSSLSNASSSSETQSANASLLDGLNRCWETSVQTSYKSGSKTIDIAVIESYQFYYDLNDKSNTTGFFSSSISVHYLYNGVELDQGYVWRVGSWRQNGRGLALSTTSPITIFPGDLFVEHSKEVLAPIQNEVSWEIEDISISDDSLTGKEDGLPLIFKPAISVAPRNISTVTDSREVMRIMKEFNM